MYWRINLNIGIVVGLFASQVSAYTANKVGFEFLQNSQYRVTINYSVPELKEYREAYVLFQKKREAEKFYWQLIRGADFYPENPKLLRYVPVKIEPTPW